jgi:hypothetical protein
MRPEFWDAEVGDGGTMTSSKRNESNPAKYDQLKCIPGRASAAGARSQRDGRNRLRYRIGAGDHTKMSRIQSQYDQLKCIPGRALAAGARS